MKCPRCGEDEDKVIDSRTAQDGTSVRRRRECLKCNERFTTYEYVERAPLSVIKSDNRREEFDRQKLRSGIAVSCNKRPVGTETIDAIVADIEAKLHQLGRAEVDSKYIGELVMNALKETDDIAYVRFASVYRRFQDKEEFLQEIKRLFG